MILTSANAFLIAHLGQLPCNHALYFSFITGLTVGYGDIVPTTPFGRLIAVLLVVAGTMFTGMVVAAAVRASTQAWKREFAGAVS